MKCEDKGRGECSKWEAGRKKSMWFWMSNYEGRRRRRRLGGNRLGWKRRYRRGELLIWENKTNGENADR